MKVRAGGAQERALALPCAPLQQRGGNRVVPGLPAGSGGQPLLPQPSGRLPPFAAPPDCSARLLHCSAAPPPTARSLASTWWRISGRSGRPSMSVRRLPTGAAATGTAAAAACRRLPPPAAAASPPGVGRQPTAALRPADYKGLKDLIKEAVEDGKKARRPGGRPAQQLSLVLASRSPPLCPRSPRPAARPRSRSRFVHLRPLPVGGRTQVDNSGMSYSPRTTSLTVQRRAAARDSAEERFFRKLEAEASACCGCCCAWLCMQLGGRRRLQAWAQAVAAAASTRCAGGSCSPVAGSPSQHRCRHPCHPLPPGEQDQPLHAGPDRQPGAPPAAPAGPRRAERDGAGEGGRARGARRRAGGGLRGRAGLVGWLLLPAPPRCSEALNRVAAPVPPAAPACRRPRSSATCSCSWRST